MEKGGMMRLRDKIDVTKDFLTESILEVMAEYGKESAKDRIKDIVTKGSIEMVATVGLDMAGSMIPGIGNAISSYRTQKQFKNLTILIEELQKKTEEIKLNFEKQTKENRKILDAILEILIYKAANTNQDEKIKYMVNGFTTLTSIQNISYDISYLFYDVLDRMTILDIAVLKISYTSWDALADNKRGLNDIMDEFGIDYYQYNSVRDNLYRMGLLENEYDDVLEKDLDLLVKNVNNLNDVVFSIQESLTNSKKKIKKKLNKSSKIKLKARDRLKISKFGRDFFEFFIKDNFKCSATYLE